jgi:hypothetical protein
VFETLDALLLTGPVSSFAMLSLDRHFKRQWHSLYKPLEKRELNEAWLTTQLSRQVLPTGVQYFSLDGTAWPRPRARTLEDRQYVYHPTVAVNGDSICVGYPCSLLDWVPTPHNSWSLTVNLQRISSTMTAGEVGVQQIKALCKARKGYGEGLDIVAADAKYGNARFLRPSYQHLPNWRAQRSRRCEQAWPFHIFMNNLSSPGSDWNHRRPRAFVPARGFCNPFAWLRPDRRAQHTDLYRADAPLTGRLCNGSHRC